MDTVDWEREGEGGQYVLVEGSRVCTYVHVTATVNKLHMRGQGEYLGNNIVN